MPAIIAFLAPGFPELQVSRSIKNCTEMLELTGWVFKMRLGNNCATIRTLRNWVFFQCFLMPVNGEPKILLLPLNTGNVFPFLVNRENK